MQPFTHSLPLLLPFIPPCSCIITSFPTHVRSSPPGFLCITYCHCLAQRARSHITLISSYGLCDAYWKGHRGSEGPTLLSGENCSYMCLICLCFPVFPLTGEYEFNPKHPTCGVHYLVLVMTDGPWVQSKLLLLLLATVAAATCRAPSSPCVCVCVSLKQVFLTRWSLDSLQCANASAD